MWIVSEDPNMKIVWMMYTIQGSDLSQILCFFKFHADIFSQQRKCTRVLPNFCQSINCGFVYTSKIDISQYLIFIFTWIRIIRESFLFVARFSSWYTTPLIIKTIQLLCWVGEVCDRRVQGQRQISGRWPSTVYSDCFPSLLYFTIFIRIPVDQIALSWNNLHLFKA